MRSSEPLALSSSSSVQLLCLHNVEDKPAGRVADRNYLQNSKARERTSKRFSAWILNELRKLILLTSKSLNERGFVVELVVCVWNIDFARNSPSRPQPIPTRLFHFQTPLNACHLSISLDNSWQQRLNLSCWSFKKRSGEEQSTQKPRNRDIENAKRPFECSS